MLDETLQHYSVLHLIDMQHRTVECAIGPTAGERLPFLDRSAGERIRFPCFPWGPSENRI
jgi:hypothetical protein